MKLPTPEEITKAAVDYAHGDIELPSQYKSFIAGANWHRQQVEPLLERVRGLISTYHKDWPVSADKDHINLGLLIQDIEALLSEEGTK